MDNDQEDEDATDHDTDQEDEEATDHDNDKAKVAKMTTSTPTLCRRP